MKTTEMLKAACLPSVLLLMAGMRSIGQENTVSTSHNTVTHTTTETSNGMEWMNNPYIWVAAGVLLLIILIAVFSRKGRSGTEVKRTVITRTEVSND